MSSTNIATVAALLGDPARAAMMDALLDGRALPAGELAQIAGVSAPTASSHLHKLLDGGLLVVRMQGRHRYYAFANAEVAHAIEALSLIAPPRQVRSLRQSLQAQRLAAARTCYNHLGGILAVNIADALVEAGRCERLDAGFTVTPEGVRFFATLAIDVRRICSGDRPFVKTCIDWTQRRQHISGPLGAGLLDALLEREYLHRSSKDRAVRVTESGRAAMQALFMRDVVQTPDS
jgi:DNA-binding transcriptional ArsR family regulator